MAKKHNGAHLGVLPGETDIITEPEVAMTPDPEIESSDNHLTLGDVIAEDRFYTLAQYSELTGLPPGPLITAFRARNPQKSGMWIMREGSRGEEVSGKSILEWFDKSGMTHQPVHALPDPEQKPIRRVPEREHRPVDKVLIEVPLCDQPIVEGFKNSEGQAKHVSFNVKSQRQSDNLRRLFSGLEEVGATVDGRKVASHADACRWLLEHLSD